MEDKEKPDLKDEESVVGDIFECMIYAGLCIFSIAGGASVLINYNHFAKSGDLWVYFAILIIAFGVAMISFYKLYDTGRSIKYKYK